VKVSQWLLKYQLTGAIPDDVQDPPLAFWCGYALGIGRIVSTEQLEDRKVMAVKLAEFIESRARE
jgi:hypothetical protein